MSASVQGQGLPDTTEPSQSASGYRPQVRPERTQSTRRGVVAQPSTSLFAVGGPSGPTGSLYQRRPTQVNRVSSYARTDAAGSTRNSRVVGGASSTTDRTSPINVSGPSKPKPVWGIGGVFPATEKRRKRGETTDNGGDKRAAELSRKSPEELTREWAQRARRRAASRASRTTSLRPQLSVKTTALSAQRPRSGRQGTGETAWTADTPGLERNDPFAALQQQYSQAPQRPASSRSHSDTVYEEPLHEEQADSPRPKSAGHRSSASDTEASDLTSEDDEPHPDSEEQGQVGGVLMEESGQWEDEFEPDEDDAPVRNSWGRYRYLCREMLAEWLGMLVLVVIGTAADCQVKISDSLAGEYSSMSWCWGFAVMAGIYIAGGISGGHLNPALTIALAIFRGFPWRMVPRYVFAQVLGAFCAAFIVYGNYRAALNSYDPQKLIYSTATGNASASLFITVPNESAGGAVQGFTQELIATSVLTILVLALGDENNAPPGAGLGALVLGFFVTAIGMSMGWISGYAINPARDFGPRLALWCLGYGTQLWTHDSWWWLIGPICGTLVGSIIGALLYDACIYCGPGSPLNSSADELAYALHLPRMHNMVRTHLYPVDSEQRAQAQRELSIEAGLEKQEIAERRKARGKSPQGEEGTGRTQNETEMRSRWEAAKSKAEKEDRKRRARRRRKVEELLAEAQERTPRQQQEADVGEQRAGPEA